MGPPGLRTVLRASQSRVVPLSPCDLACHRGAAFGRTEVTWAGAGLVADRDHRTSD